MFANHYLQRFAYPGRHIAEEPNEDLYIIVVIPCFNETELIKSLEALKQCQLPPASAEVITVINCSESSDSEIKEINHQTYISAKAWADVNNSEKLKFHFIYTDDLPRKSAGVGLARKIGMDEAVKRFHLLQKPGGIITGFDADSLCDENYLTEIYELFTRKPKTKAASIYYEHPLDSEIQTLQINTGITQYELHLRYFYQALKYIRFPHAYHTIGSSFAVRADVYCMQGGMNKKQAGEDFYFLHKIIPLGNYEELNTTKVIPSPRPSDRVPFGTGAAINKYISNDTIELETYNFSAFRDIKIFIEKCSEFFKTDNHGANQIVKNLPLPLNIFLQDNDFIEAYADMKKNSTELSTFEKRFFTWFNAFRIIRFLNIMHEKHYTKLPVTTQASILLKECYNNNEELLSAKEMLLIYRKLERPN